MVFMTTTCHFEGNNFPLRVKERVSFTSLSTRVERREREAAEKAEQLRILRENNAAAAALTLKLKQAISIGCPVYSHLRHNVRGLEAAERVRKTLMRHLGVTDVRVLPEWAHDLETLRKRLLSKRKK